MKIKYITFLAVFIIGIIVLSFSSAPKLIWPNNNTETTETKITFLATHATKIYIDDNFEFSSTIKLNKENKLDLKPGTYYWKAKNLFRKSETRKFTIISKVSLELDEKPESYIVKNTGNTEVEVAKKVSGNIVGKVILSPEEKNETDKQNNTIFEGRENEIQN